MYLDPGFGGMLVQGLVVIAAVGGAILFSLRKKIRALFSRSDKNNVSPVHKPASREAGQENDVDVIDTLSKKE